MRIEVYGDPEEIELITEYARSMHISKSAFILKTVLAEIGRHPRKETTELIAERLMKEILLKYGLITKDDVEEKV